MRIILDENLWPELATALNALEQRYHLTFLHINDIAPGEQDEDILRIAEGKVAAVAILDPPELLSEAFDHPLKGRSDNQRSCTACLPSWPTTISASPLAMS